MAAPGAYHETVEEALAAWDAGEIVWSVEMGGLGPGYEQALQIAAIELCRKLLAAGGVAAITRATAQTDPEALDRLVRLLSHEVNRECYLGLSGAQAGAAMNLALRLVRDGWAKAIESAPQDRRIMVSKDWPGKRDEEGPKP